MDEVRNIHAEGEELLPDFPYRNLVEFLRHQLWQRKPGRAAGRASLMVGAGFSRNAEPVSAAARPFPDWDSMTRMFSEALYPGLDPATIAPGTSGALRLAQEFEAAFGRFPLEELIRGAIPDAEYRPGSLHTRLLSLPWADVFTTNWDTLVERARLEVPDRLYDVVLTPSQIPSASVPRIVKLHGTLPSHTPFIFTEEDYRTYPSRFTPLVNMVQQAMVENAFVLLGFSGDDPNFLAWSGWVRDNLGPHAPKIYLVGYLGLGPQRRRMLEERNVVPVDLAALPQAADWPRELRHRYATEWFLHALEVGRPPRAGSWPLVPEPPRALPPHLHPLLPGDAARTVDEPWPKASITADPSTLAAELSEAAMTWTANRRSYPGWELAPFEVRTRLWHSATLWLWRITHALMALEVPRRIAVLREMLWRLEVCLIEPDLVGNLGKVIQDILGEVDPAARVLRRTDGTTESLDAEAIEGVRVMARSLIRLARRDGDKDDFNAHLAVLAASAAGDAEVGHQVQYERLLWHAQRLEHERLEVELGAWDVDAADPVWGIRKAGLLLEIARMDEAGFTLRTAFSRLRRERRRDADDLASLSKEGWGLWLTRALSLHDPAAAQPWDWPNAEDRWRDLSLQDCNAPGDYQQLVSELLQPPERNGASRERGFDVGATSVTMSFRSGLPTPFRAALQLRRLAEVAGVPAQAMHVTLLRDGLARSAKILADSYPLACALDVMRIATGASDDLLTGHFSRARVATLDAAVAAQVVESAVGSLDYAFPRARPPEPRHDYWHRRLSVALEVLSRIILRSPPGEALEVLGRAESLYRAAWPLLDRQISSGLNDLIQRCIESFPADILRAQLPRLLALPIPGAASFLPGFAHASWTDPAVHVSMHRPDVIDAGGERNDAVWRTVVQGALRAASSSTAARPYAVSRLALLHRMGVLTEDENAALAEVVWAKDWRIDGGLPSDLALHPWAFLVLPEPRPGVAAEAFRRTLLLDSSRRLSLDETLWNLGRGLWQTRLTGRKLLDGEAAAAVSEIVSQWATRPIAPAESHFASHARHDEISGVNGLGLLLTEHPVDVGVLDGVWRRVQDLEGAGPTRAYSLFPALARAFPNRVGELVDRLRRGLAAADPEVAGQAFYGLYRWIEATSLSSGVPGVPDDLIAEVGVAIAARRPGAVARALEVGRWVFKEGTSDARELIAANCDIGLTYLISEASYEAELRSENSAAPSAALLRRNCTMLALAMEASGYGSGGGVTAWLRTSREDPMPEVRRLIEEQTTPVASEAEPG